MALSGVGESRRVGSRRVCSLRLLGERWLKHESAYVFDHRSTGTASEVPEMCARAGDEHRFDRLRHEKLWLVLES